MCERAITEKWKKGMEVEGGSNRVKECVCVTVYDSSFSVNFL